MTDYYGLATLIAALSAAIVAVLSAIQSFRNGSKIAEVHTLTNSMSEKLQAKAHEAGVTETNLAHAMREMEAKRVRESSPNV